MTDEARELTAEEKREVAYHEAGHWVADFKLGPEGSYPGSISIITSGDTLGSVSGEPPLGDGADEQDLVNGLIRLYAGYTATVELNPDPAEEERFRAWAADDDEQADMFLEWFGYQGERKDQLKQKMRGKTQVFVKEHWAQISALAEEVLRHRSLDEEEAEWVVQAAEGVEGAKEALAEYRVAKARWRLHSKSSEIS